MLKFFVKTAVLAVTGFGLGAVTASAHPGSHAGFSNLSMVEHLISHPYHLGLLLFVLTGFAGFAYAALQRSRQSIELRLPLRKR